MRKGQTAMEYLMTYGWAILIIMIVVVVLFYLGVFNLGATVSQCTFPPGFTCVTNKLQAGTAKLYLKLGQGTGHPIQVNGINCTQQTDANQMSSGSYVSYSNYNIGSGASSLNISSGSSAVVADAMNTSGSDYPAVASNIICTQADGLPGDTTIGTFYNGNIYINYTELDTGLTRIISGTYSAAFET